MILNKIYTHPKKLFDDVVFHNGLNIIYAHKDESIVDDSKSSLHAVGKSTLLDLILFALLFDFDKSSHRLHNAYDKKILRGLSVILEFSVNDVQYYINRSFDHPNNKIYFGSINNGVPHTSGKLRAKLYALIFERDNYPGVNSKYWYHKLFSFFIKVKKRDELFSDPIEFSRNLSDLEATPFHFFLLNIDNGIPSTHKDILESIFKLESFLKEQVKLLKEKSKSKDLTVLENKRQKLKNTIKKLEKRIDTFSLTDNYIEFESQADTLTSAIKNLWFKNAVDKKKLQDLESLEKSLPSDVYENISHISNIYNEVNHLLAGTVKKTLQEAVEFRKVLHSSRKEFIRIEKGRLNNSIYHRSTLISNAESDRKKIFDKLSEQSALNDLTNTYSRLAQFQQQLSDIESSLKTIDKLKEDITAKKDEHGLLLEKVREYLESIKSDVDQFRNLINSVYGELFLDSHDVKIFDVSETEEKQKIQISVLEGSITDSTGINQVRTLIYDIAVLLNIIKKDLNAPRFIIHDGIFENLHKSHFLAFMGFIESLLANNVNFQYILTLNEHDYLNEIENFENDKIIKNSIIKLSPNNKLFGAEF